MSETKRLAHTKQRERGWFGRLVLGLRCLIFSVLLSACQTTIGPADSDPHCPQWNETEWLSFTLMIQHAELRTELQPAVLATGSLLQFCFPWAFEDA